MSPHPHAAGAPTWKKVAPGVPHLSRWYAFLSGLPQLAGCLKDLDWKAAKAAGATAGMGGSGERRRGKLWRA